VTQANSITTIGTEPLNYLFASDSEDGSVNTVRVEDKVTRPSKVTVDLQGLPVLIVVQKLVLCVQEGSSHSMTKEKSFQNS